MGLGPLGTPSNILMSKPTPSVEKRPYMVVTHPHGDPVYRASFKSAQNLVLLHLNAFKATFLALNVQDALEAILHLEDEVHKLPSSGGKIEGVIDPYTGIKYQVEIVRRQGL